MEKETYKVALEILNRFADTSTRLQHQQTFGVTSKTKKFPFQNPEQFSIDLVMIHSFVSKCADDTSEISAKTLKQFDAVHTAADTNVVAATVSNPNQCSCLATTTTRQ